MNDFIIHFNQNGGFFFGCELVKATLLLSQNEKWARVNHKPAVFIEYGGIVLFFLGVICS